MQSNLSCLILTLFYKSMLYLWEHLRWRGNLFGSYLCFVQLCPLHHCTNCTVKAEHQQQQLRKVHHQGFIHRVWFPLCKALVLLKPEPCWAESHSRLFVSWPLQGFLTQPWMSQPRGYDDPPLRNESSRLTSAVKLHSCSGESSHQ